MLSKEPIAKLHDSEKSMIFDSIARAGEACPKCTDGGLPRAAGEEVWSQWSQKGRFCASKSFAIGSKPLIILVRLYQWCIRPMLGNCCRFYPSCSEYAVEALKKHGPFKGVFLTIKRIVKCHPWHLGGVDLVP